MVRAFPAAAEYTYKLMAIHSNNDVLVDALISECNEAMLHIPGHNTDVKRAAVLIVVSVNRGGRVITPEEAVWVAGIQDGESVHL